MIGPVLNRYGSRREARVARYVLALALLLVLSGSDAFALQKDTWKNVSPSRDPRFARKVIGCGYFWNANRGLIGSGVRPLLGVDTFGRYVPIPMPEVSIYYTSDGGSSWQEAVLPKKTTGAVTQIWMIDSLNGYASIFSDYPHSYYRSFGKSALWKTSDGGHSWYDPYNYDHLLSCVYAQNDLIVVTQWDSYYTSYPLFADTTGGAYSFDGGLTWQRNFRRGNGIAFSDSLNGVVTEMNADTSDLNFWVTVDAGRTWSRTLSPLYESWSVYAIPNERTYFVAGESQYYLPHTTIYRSTDGGFVWDPVVTLPDIHFAGTINGKGSTLYFQTDTIYNINGPQMGMYRSDDLGSTWKWVGGPSNSRDTRFCVTGCSGEVVYAFDAKGGVWKTEDGGDGTLEGGNPYDAQMVPSGTEFTVSPEACGDTLQFTLYSTSCVPVTIDSVVQIEGEDFIHRSPIQTTKLGEGESVDVTLVYQPLTDTPTSSKVRVYAHSGYRKMTQDVTYNLQKSLRTAMILSTDSLQMQTAGCAVTLDSVYVGILGCPDVILDSLTLERGELHALDVYPDTLTSKEFRPRRFLFAPDSSGEHDYAVTLHGHSNRRAFDTTIYIHAASVRAPEYFVLSDTSHAFLTNYCEQRQFALLLGSTSCDSIHIDSIVSSTPSFFAEDSVNAFPGSGTKAINIYYSPSSVGADTGYVRIVGHSTLRSIDTLIRLTGINRGNPDPIQLSDTAVDLATSACLPTLSGLTLTNQCCDVLEIDSIFAEGGEFSVQFDWQLRSMQSNDTLPLTIAFAPDSGGFRVTRLHIRGHIPGRTIDTVVMLSAVNALSQHPLEIASDTLYLSTKYCHTVVDSLDLANLGCPNLVIDSVAVEDDARGEFSVVSYTSPLRALGDGVLAMRFTPDTSGRRIAHARVFAHLGEQYIDTVLTLIGRNFTAPEPFLVPADSQYAGRQLRTALYFRPTTDTFAIKSFSAHLAFNTDILTPIGLAFDGTCSLSVQSSSVTADATGARVDVVYTDSLRQSDDVTLPVVWLVSNVSLTKDLTTSILLEGFSTDVEPQLTLCSVPESQFTTLLECGDPVIVQFLQTGHITIASIQPNPTSAGHPWTVSLRCNSAVEDVRVELFTLTGSRISATALGKLDKDRSAAVAAPPASGDYFLVVRSERGVEDVRRVTILN